MARPSLSPGSSPNLSHVKRFRPTRLLQGRCVKVLWRKRGANAAYCCNLDTAAEILGEQYRLSTNLGVASAEVAGKTPDPAGRPLDRRRPAVQALRQGAAPRIHRIAGRSFGLPLYRRRGDELGPTHLSLEHARVLGHGRPPAGNQPAQRPRHPRKIAPVDARSWHLHRRPGRSARRCLLSLATRLPRVAVPAAGGVGADRARADDLQACRLAPAGPRGDSEKAERDHRDLSLSSSSLISSSMRAASSSSKRRKARRPNESSF